MNIQITSKNIEMTEAIRSYIEKRIGSLEKFLNTIQEAHVEIERNQHHKKGYVFQIAVNMPLAHGFVRATDVQEDMYVAIDVVKEELERQLREQKGKFEDRKRRASKTQRLLKSIFYFWQ